MGGEVIRTERDGSSLVVQWKETWEILAGFDGCEQFLHCRQLDHANKNHWKFCQVNPPPRHHHQLEETKPGSSAMPVQRVPSLSVSGMTSASSKFLIRHQTSPFNLSLFVNVASTTCNCLSEGPPPTQTTIPQPPYPRFSKIFFWRNSAKVPF